MKKCNVKIKISSDVNEIQNQQICSYINSQLGKLKYEAKFKKSWDKILEMWDIREYGIYRLSLVNNLTNKGFDTAGVGKNLIKLIGASIFGIR